jgi:hypothetical protein
MLQVSSGISYKETEMEVKLIAHLGEVSIEKTASIPNEKVTSQTIAETTIELICAIEREFSGMLRDTVLGRKHV